MAEQLAMTTGQVAMALGFTRTGFRDWRKKNAAALGFPMPVDMGIGNPRYDAQEIRDWFKARRGRRLPEFEGS